MTTSNHWIFAQTPTLIYIGDPMCSWCYGFAPEISELNANLDDYEFKLVLGGLRPGGTDNMKDMGEFLDHHWKEVHERTGQPFNHGIIGDENFILDTEPGCRAVVAARTLQPGIDLEFFKAVQHAFFVENKDMRATDTFVAIAEQFGLDADRYRDVFESEECKYETRGDFQLSSEMGIRGFPSVVIRHEGQLYMIANGYTTSERMTKTVEKIAESKSKK